MAWPVSSEQFKTAPEWQRIWFNSVVEEMIDTDGEEMHSALKYAFFFGPKYAMMAIILDSESMAWGDEKEVRTTDYGPLI
ncbi:MAG: hypothetical protein KGJ13_08070 [Patescibacteria group bacterium]|nr:hypothetical protein [Patescibacteria group bacterium]